jgi:hypothetical protein
MIKNRRVSGETITSSIKELRVLFFATERPVLMDLPCPAASDFWRAAKVTKTAFCEREHYSEGWARDKATSLSLIPKAASLPLCPGGSSNVDGLVITLVR